MNSPLTETVIDEDEKASKDPPQSMHAVEGFRTEYEVQKLYPRGRREYFVFSPEYPYLGLVLLIYVDEAREVKTAARKNALHGSGTTDLRSQNAGRAFSPSRP